MIITATFLYLPLSSQCISSSKAFCNKMEKLKLPLWKPFKRKVINVLYCISGYYAVSPGGQVFNTQLLKCCRSVTCFLIYCQRDHNIPYTNHAVMSGKENNVFDCMNRLLYLQMKWSFCYRYFFFFLQLVAANQHEKSLQRTPISILRVFFSGYCILKRNNFIN